MRKLWPGLNALMALLFVFSATLQWNDPEPFQWIAIYLAAAIPCALAIRRTPSWILPATIAVVTVAWEYFYFRSGAWSVPLTEAFSTWKMRNQEMLEKRELTGLLIVTGWMLVLIVADLRARRK
jgi:hypothetical protein